MVFRPFYDWKNLPQLAGEVAQQKQLNAKHTADARRIIEQELHGEQEGRAFQSEFRPEVVNGDPEPEPVTERTEFSEKVLERQEVLGWSEATVRLQLSLVEGDMVALERQMLEELEGDMRPEEGDNGQAV